MYIKRYYLWKNNFLWSFLLMEVICCDTHINNETGRLEMLISGMELDPELGTSLYATYLGKPPWCGLFHLVNTEGQSCWLFLTNSKLILGMHFFTHSFHFWIVCLRLKFKQALLSVFNYNLMEILLAFKLAFSFHITNVHPSYCVIIISCYNGFIMQVPAGLN